MIRLLSRFFSFLLSIPVWFYKGAISPLLPPACRHVPTCSEYMITALKMHGPLTGLAMGINRIIRCRPGGTHGFDPVPRFRFKTFEPFKRYPRDNRLKER